MTVHIGILGFAHGHVNAYCRRWRTEPDLDVRVVAGWDHDPSRAEQGATNHELQRCDSVGQLLGRDDVEAVVVAAETSYHAELCEQAAAAGKAIILQKPMALTLEEADRILDAVERSPVPFTMAWQMRVDPQNLAIRELVESGRLGRIFMVRRRHGLSTHLWDWFADSWHVDPTRNRDIWADDAAHAIDFIYWLLGEPRTVTAELATLCNPRVPNDNGVAVFTYDGGPIAVVNCSFTCPAGENTTEVIGADGVVIQNFGDGPSANVPRPKGGVGLKWMFAGAKEWEYSDLPSPNSQGERIAALAGPLAEFLHGRRAPIATAQDGRTALRMVLACYESAETGRRVTLK